MSRLSYSVNMTIKRIGIKTINAIPSPVFRRTATEALNRSLRKSLRKGDLDFLDGKCWKITVADTNKSIFIINRRRRLLVIDTQTPPDIAFFANSESYLRMVLKKDSTDKLIVSRRLGISGDAKLMLGVKRFIDNMQVDDVFDKPTLLVLNGVNWVLSQCEQ